MGKIKGYDFWKKIRQSFISNAIYKVAINNKLEKYKVLLVT